MPHVQVRDVPAEVHDVLVHRAQAAGQSLQQYLTAELARLAATPTLDEMLERIDSYVTGHVSGADAVSALRSERDRR